MNRSVLILALLGVMAAGCASTSTEQHRHPKPELVRVESAAPQSDLSEYHPAEVVASVGPMGATQHLMYDMPSRFKGTVTLELEVRTDGTVGPVMVVSGLDPIFDREATKAAKQWRFRPTMSPSGEPVASWVRIQITFQKR